MGPFLGFPVTVIIQIALVQLLSSWGIVPSAVTGHSSGEIAAGYASGILSFEEAIAVASIRGQLTSEFVDSGRLGGGMISVGMDRVKASEYVQTFANGRAVVACVNSPSNVTISGSLDAIDDIESWAKGENIFARKLNVPAAYHSPNMQPLLEEYVARLTPHLKSSETRELQADFYSSVTGDAIVDPRFLRTGHYWASNMTQCVLFEDSLSAMVARKEGEDLANIDIFVEVGPHGALQSFIREIITSKRPEATKVHIGSCLKRNQDAVQSIQQLAGMCYNAGLDIDLAKINFPDGSSDLQVLRDLPQYQWNHSKGYWIEPSLARDMLHREFPRHELLGVRVEGLNPGCAVWRTQVRVSDLPWLQEHLMQSEILYPGAGMVSMVAEAVRQLKPSDDPSRATFVLKEIDLVKAIIVPNNSVGVELQLMVQDANAQLLASDGIKEFALYSRDREGEWVSHFKGKVDLTEVKPDPVPAKLEGLEVLEIPEFYEYLATVGPSLGPFFQNIKTLARADGVAVATVAIPESLPVIAAPYQSTGLIHPVVLDACFQSAWATVPRKILSRLGLSIPRFADSLFFSLTADLVPGSVIEVRASLISLDHQGFTVSLIVCAADDATRTPIMKADSLKIWSMSQKQTTPQVDNTIFMKTTWRQDIEALNERDLQEISSRIPNEVERQAFQDLEQAAANIIHDTLERLGPEEKALDGHWPLFMSWMREQDDAYYPQNAIHDEEQKRLFYEKVMSTSINGRLLRLVEENILKFLRQEAQPLESLLRDGFLYELYADAFTFAKFLEEVTSYTSLFAHKHPRARILEVGGGTGSCTAAATAGLKSSSGSLAVETYDFTDVSTGFFEQAQRKFESFLEQMRFRKFDIEKDGPQQGFEAESYDLIIGSNVIHATTNLENTLGNLKRLLRPGGKLLMVETTRDHLDQNLAFGLLPGWWLSEEKHRKWSPLLSAAAWTDTLQNVGFEKPAVIPNIDSSTVNATYSLLVSSKPKQTPSAYIGDVVIVHFPDQEPAPKPWIDDLSQSISEHFGSSVSQDSLGGSSISTKLCIVVAGTSGRDLSHMDQGTFILLKKTLREAGSLIWISHGATGSSEAPESALHSGLLRTMRLEVGGRRYVSLDLDPIENPWIASSIKAISDVITLSLGEGGNPSDFEFAYRSGQLLIPRLSGDYDLNEEYLGLEGTPLQKQASYSSSGKYLRLQSRTPGILDELIFQEGEDSPQSVAWTEEMVEVIPHAFGLNFRDVLVAMGKMQEEWMGFECAGYISRLGGNVPDDLRQGDRVVVLMPRGHLANRIRVPWTAVAPVPRGMSLETAASLPMVFFTCFHAFYNISRLGSGGSVLIHSAAGGVGQAAITLAQHIGAEIFVTVGLEEKRAFLGEKYGIPADHIFSSRDRSFADGISQATKGKGVDVVLNSLAGPLLDASLDCLAPFGHFIELGKQDSQSNKLMEMKYFHRCISYTSMDVTQLGQKRGIELSRTFRHLMRLFDEGHIVSRIPIQTFRISEAVKAFRTLQGGKHMGKIVLTAHEGETITVRKFGFLSQDLRIGVHFDMLTRILFYKGSSSSCPSLI